MVVGDDDVQTQVASVGYLVGSANATIHGDDDFDAFLGQFAQSTLVESISFINAVGDIRLHLRVQGCQGLDEQGSGRHPVGVEITIDGNRLSLSESLAEAGDGLVHALEAERIILWPITFQKSPDLRGCAETPVIE